MRRAVAALALALAGCSSSELPADQSAKLDPIAFFIGRSHATAQLDTILGRPEPVSVDSIGRLGPGGRLILDQVIRQGHKAPRQRRWLMVPISGGKYTGSLTDADGPVTVTVAGPRATIRYRMRNGMSVDQQLALQRDRRTLLNRLEVSRFGLRLATLKETIRKVG